MPKKNDEPLSESKHKTRTLQGEPEKKNSHCKSAAFSSKRADKNKNDAAVTLRKPRKGHLERFGSTTLPQKNQNRFNL